MQKFFKFFDKHFFIMVCLAFFLLYIPLLLREWYLLKNEMFHEIGSQTQAMISLLRRELEYIYPFPEILEQFDNQEQFEKFDVHMRHLLEHQGLIKVKFYDREGVVLYSNDPAIIGDSFYDLDFEKAFSGKTTTSIISQNDYEQEYGESIDVPLVEVYTPLYAAGAKKPSYVLEAYQDFTPFQNRINRILLQNAISLAIVIAVLLSILALFSWKRRTLEKKVETLEKILPICCICKKIRGQGKDRDEEWLNFEEYFNKKAGVDLSHGYCPECYKKELAHLDSLHNRKKKKTS